MTMLRFDASIGRIYGADLIGAGAGAIAIMLLLSLFEPQTILRLLSLAGLAAGLLLLRMSGRRSLSAALLGAAAVLVILLPSSWLELRLSEYKGLEQTLLVDGVGILDSHSSPVSRIDVVESRQIPFRHAPGLSLQSPSGVPEQLGVFVDGDAMSAIDRGGVGTGPGYRAYVSSALPYELGRRLDEVLVLNSGTGADILQAAAYGSDSIDAVEADARLTKLISDIFADYAGWPAIAGRVSFHAATARAWAASSTRHYDLIVRGVPGASSGGAAGVFAFAAGFDLTVDAIEDYLAILKPGGYLAITLWTDTPPKGNLRLFASVVEALKASGVGEPGRRLAWIRSWNTATLLVKQGDLTDDEIGRIRDFARTRGFDLAWLPGIEEAEANRYQILPRAYFHDAAQALLGDRATDYIADYEYDIEPVRDSDPYFNDHFRWKSLPQFLALPGRAGIAMIDAGYPTLIASLLQAVAAALVLILLPLLFLKRKASLASGSRLHVILYFTAIGLAFLFIELSFIELLTLIIGQPLYAVAITLCLFLLFSGLGSLTVQWLQEKGFATAVILRSSVFGILVITLAYILLRGWMTEHLMSLPLFARILAASLFTAPLAFAMGMPFPLGLTATSRSAPALVPWAWGINGCASVLSAILAVLLSMEIGFHGVMLCAVALYLLAWRTLPGTRAT
ncbi:MAG: SAM-dependent methyltransferase [Gammaproteobacteria bacterium]